MFKIIGKIFLVLTVIFFCLIIGEILVRRQKPQMTFLEAIGFSTRCYDHNLPIPFTLWKNATCHMTQYANDYNLYAHINSSGYRGQEFAYKKSADTKRILVLGDSTTFGFGVEDNETIPYFLSESLKSQMTTKFQVINAGYASGFSPDSAYVYLKNEGLKLKPDIIILNFSVFNDIIDIVEMDWTKTDPDGLPTEIQSKTRVVDNHYFRNRQIAFKYSIPILRESHLFLLTIDIFQKIFPSIFKIDSKYSMPQYPWECGTDKNCLPNLKNETEKMKKIILAINNLAKQNQAHFILVLCPAVFQISSFSNPSWWENNADEPNFIQNHIREMFQNNSITIFDLYPIIKSQPNPESLYFTHDAHFTAIGNKLSGMSIASFIASNSGTFLK